MTERCPHEIVSRGLGVCQMGESQRRSNEAGFAGCAIRTRRPRADPRHRWGFSDHVWV